MSTAPVKCVVWDLDNTVWDGVLMEDPEVRVRAGILEVIVGLDERGILNSVASRNDPALAEAKLADLGLAEYLVAPQIGWNAKSHALARVAESLGIGSDALAFVDDDPFERAQVESELASVRCLEPAEIAGLLDRPEFSPPVVTDEARQRRLMYQVSERRSADEEAHVGPKDEFLQSLGLVCEITPAEPGDLARAEELTVRTNQLNTTGAVYSEEKLSRLIRSDRHLVFVARLADRYGTYGTVGLAVVEKDPLLWRLPLLLMSCRVLSRGAGGIMLGHVMRLASRAGAHLAVPLVDTGRNRMMVVTLRFAGFRLAGSAGGMSLYEHDLQVVPEVPAWVELRTSGAASL